MHTLIIGCGNRLRSDDGVGPRIAEAVASWRLPGVRGLAVHQLTPELAEEIAQAERVLFVDASRTPLAGAFEVCKIEPCESRRQLGHHDTPANLLAIARELSGREPDAWLLAIAVESLDFGESLSQSAAANMQAALAWLAASVAGAAG